MGITVNSLNWKKFLLNLDIPSDKVAALEQLPMLVSLTAQNLKFDWTGKNVGGVSGVTVPLSLDDIHGVMTKKISPAKLPSLKSHVLTKINYVLSLWENAGLHPAKATVVVVNTPAPSLKSAPPLGKVAATPTPEPKPVPNSHVPVDAAPFAPLLPAEANKQQPVKLRDATRMYQPVKGSSGGSRYALVAAAPDLKVGLRIKGHSMSFRVEGSNLNAYKAHLVSLFDGQDKGDYLSMHLGAESDELKAKTIGAVLMAVNRPFLTPFPSLKILKELTYA